MRLVLLAALLLPLAAQPQQQKSKPTNQAGKRSGEAADSGKGTSVTPPKSVGEVEPSVRPADKPTAEDNKPRPNNEPKTTDWWMVGLTAAYVFVAIVTMLTIKRQANIAEISALAAKKGADIAEQALKISERAELQVEAAGINTGKFLIGESMVTVQVKNFGRTKATNAKLNVHLIVPEVAALNADALPCPLPSSAPAIQSASPFSRSSSA